MLVSSITNKGGATWDMLSGVWQPCGNTLQPRRCAAKLNTSRGIKVTTLDTCPHSRHGSL